MRIYSFRCGFVMHFESATKPQGEGQIDKSDGNLSPFDSMFTMVFGMCTIKCIIKVQTFGPAGAEARSI